MRSWPEPGVETLPWEPADLEGDQLRSRARWSFEQAFAAEAPALFAVMPPAEGADAVHAQARRAAPAAGYADGFACGTAAARARARGAADAERVRSERAAHRTQVAAEHALQAPVR